MFLQHAWELFGLKRKIYFCGAEHVDGGYTVLLTQCSFFLFFFLRQTGRYANVKDTYSPPSLLLSG